MDGLGQKKDLLRSQVKSLKANVEISISKFVEAVEVSNISSVGLFKPLKDEPILKDLPIDWKICWPGITDQSSSQMQFFEAAAFHKSELGFLEPSQESKVPPEQISIVFVPGQAFDVKGNRLGRGKGFYDRYLKNFNGITVGVCSKDRFLTEPIPVDQRFDVSLQYILTEDFVYKVNPIGKVV